MSHVVIGLGETGQALYNVLAEKCAVQGIDPAKGFNTDVRLGNVMLLHICIPYSESFRDTVIDYQCEFNPRHTVIHSTVPVGTTRNLANAVHSPILGRHDNMEESLKEFRKWVGGERAGEVCEELVKAGFTCKIVPTPEETELMKLMCLAKYGMSLAFTAYQRAVSSFFDIPYERIVEWDMNYNAHVAPNLRRPVFEELKLPIGGHCVIQNTKLLNEQYPSPLLDEILKRGGGEEALPKLDEYEAPRIWEPSNVYSTAKIGSNVHVGTFCEIGNNVVIGNNVRIGAYCFIPQGVTIERNAWIGPRVTFANDMYPPSGEERWQPTLVKRAARIGAAVSIRPGVTIGEGALIGMGAVVTEDVPDGETWAGVPAKRVESRACAYV
ncbi:MAG: acyltransferase [Planctomycetota bacterium]|jgi:acetyltransferase-like isoleucine patch superfamily enzyme